MYYHFLIRKVTYYIPFLEFIDITFNVNAPNIRDKKYIIFLISITPCVKSVKFDTKLKDAIVSSSA